MTSAIATAVYLGAVKISLERSSHTSLRPKVSGGYTRLHVCPERCAPRYKQRFGDAVVCAPYDKSGDCGRCCVRAGHRRDTSVEIQSPSVTIASNL